MTKEEIYLNHKKKSLIEHINRFNTRVRESWQFPIDKDNLDVEKTFCTPDVCQNCGICCSTCPCIFAPSDFLDINNLDYMRSLLDTGVICISETFRGETLIIRPRGVGDLGIVSLKHQVKFSGTGNPCSLHSNKGCLLPVMYRPSEGLLYYALEQYDHIVMYTEKNIDDEYRPYSEVLNILLHEYLDKKTPIESSSENIAKLTRALAGYKRKR